MIDSSYTNMTHAYTIVNGIHEQSPPEMVLKLIVIVIVIVILTLQQEEQERTYNTCIKRREKERVSNDGKLAIAWASNDGKLAIIGRQVYSDAQTWRENCVNVRRYCQTVAEVRGTWCTKNDARDCLPLSLWALKWPSENIDLRISVPISRHRCLYLLRSCFWRDYSIDTMAQDLSNLQYISW